MKSKDKNKIKNELAKDVILRSMGLNTIHFGPQVCFDHFGVEMLEYAMFITKNNKSVSVGRISWSKKYGIVNRVTFKGSKYVRALIKILGPKGWEKCCKTTIMEKVREAIEEGKIETPVIPKLKRKR